MSTPARKVDEAIALIETFMYRCSGSGHTHWGWLSVIILCHKVCQATLLAKLWLSRLHCSG